MSTGPNGERHPTQPGDRASTKWLAPISSSRPSSISYWSAGRATDARVYAIHAAASLDAILRLARIVR